MSDPVSERTPSASTPLDPRELARCFAGTRRLASALLGAESLGEDAAQDVILAALQRPPRLERGVGAWFAGALRRRILHLRRGESRRLRHQRAANDERRAPEPHEALARAEIQERLVAAARTLPEPYRTPILLRYLEEHDTREVAEMLDRPLSTVQTQLQRGLALLRERFAADQRAERNDWRDALAILCVPHPGAIRARIDELERGLRARPLGRGAGLTLLGAAALSVAVVLTIVLRQPAAPLATRTNAESAGMLQRVSLDRREASERSAVGDSSSPSDASPAPASTTTDAHSLATQLIVRSAATLAPLRAARAYVDRGPAPGVSTTPRSADRAAALRADERGAIAIELEPTPCWVRVEAEGYVGALLHLEDLRGPIEVELDAACALEVVVEPGARLLAAKVWRPSVFPVATPPFVLTNVTPPVDTASTTSDARPQTTARIELAAGRYVVSAMCERDGARIVDTALIELTPGDDARWTALDAREGEVELTLSRAPPPEQRWSAALLLGTSGQMGFVATGSGDARLRWHSVPAGEHQLVLALDNAEIARRPVTISTAPAQEVLVELPRAELTVELQVVEGTAAMCLLHGPLERPRAARRTYNGVGPRARFAALPPGRYEAWLRTPRGFGRSEVRVVEGAQHLALREEQDARSLLNYRGACSLERQELVLLAASGARLPITFGSYADAARERGFSGAEHEPTAEDGSVTVALPAGEYELLCTVDGEFRLPQLVRLAPGSACAVGASEEPRSLGLTFTRAGRPLARQAVELAGCASGATPLDAAPGALWMYSVTTDGAGRVELPLAPAHWTALLAGGAICEFDVDPATRELALALPLTGDVAR